MVRWFGRAAGAVVVAGMVLAQDVPIAVGEPWRAVVRTWTATDGLPQSTAQAMLAARDGHLWVGTLGGLCQIDGLEVRTHDAGTTRGLGSDRTTALAEDPAGTLWIGTERGLTRRDRGGFATEPELGDVHVSALATDAAGNLLVATATGLFVRTSAGFERRHGGQLANASALLRRHSGEMLAALRDAVVRFDGERVEIVCRCLPEAVAETPDGVLYIGDARGLFAWREQRLVPFQPIAALAGQISDLLVATDGALWAATAQGAVRIAADLLQAGGPAMAPAAPTGTAGPDGLRGRAVLSLAEDREGGIWIGTRDACCARLRRAELLRAAPGSGLPTAQYMAVAGGAEGALWVSTSKGLFVGRGGAFARVVAGPDGVRGMLGDHDGSVWVGTAAGAELLREGTRELLAGVPAVNVRAFARDREGMLLGGDFGLLRWRDGRVEAPAFARPVAGLPVRTIVCAPDGAIWVSATDRLVRLAPDGGPSRSWRCGAELPYGEVRSIVPEAGAAAWCATYGSGLVRVDGDTVVVVDEANGLLDRSLCAVLVDGDRWIVSSNSGFFAVQRSQLDAVAAGQVGRIACHPLAAESGASAEGNGGLQACAAVVDGRLYFCCLEDLFVFEPAAVAAPTVPLPCRIDALTVGEQQLPMADVVDVPGELGTISVRLGTCSFDHPRQVRFRWRLLGRDDAWSESTPEREVVLAGLEAGDYMFEAEVVDVAAGVSPRPARLRVRVLPTWFASWPFRGLALLAVLVLGWAAVRIGSSLSAARAVRLQAQVDERTRELQLAQDQLEARVAERTRALELAIVEQQQQMTERQQLERQLQQLQRMESLGQLAGGVAHDFNNLLTIVTGAVELIPDESRQEVEILCRSVRAACARGQRLTQHLLAVASRQIVMVGVLDLGRTVAELLPVLRPLLGEDIELQYVPPGQVCEVRAAVTQVEQILINLAANARDAMPRGGRFAIAIESAAGEVALTVADTGVGMAPDVVERVFEPFFTTKSSGGRGLGMSTVYGICKQLGGGIAIDSVVGTGTKVIVRLPLATSGAAVGETTVVLDPHVPVRTTGRVLLVEDDAAVRSVLRRLLERAGCSVHDVAGGDAAVAALARTPMAFDVVVSDVVMPGLQGAALVHALRAIRPELPLVFTSGYLEGKQTYQDLVALGLEVVGKPPTLIELVHAIERACARPAPSSPDAAAVT